jgi:hypothetical protein
MLTASMTSFQVVREGAIPSYRTIMDLLTIILVLVLVGVLLWLINTFIPMDGKIKKLLNVSVVVILIIWLLKAAGILSYLGRVHL